MRKVIYVFILISIVFVTTLTSCVSPKWFWLSSSGIMTYNRHTGQFEVLWENSVKQENDTTVIVTKGRKIATSTDSDREN